MKRFREMNPLTIGVIGIVLTSATVLTALNYDKLPIFSGGSEYRALFSEAAGLSPGDQVMAAGVNVGKVENVALDGPRVLVTFTVSDGIALGNATGVDIKTSTILGRKALGLRPSGPGKLSTAATIPQDRTTSPYSLTGALGDLTNTVGDLNTNQMGDSLKTLAATLQNTPADLRSALTGLSRLSTSINSRDAMLQDLLGNAESVTSVLSQRSTQLNTLILDGNSLLAELDRRRGVLSELFVNVQAVANQLTGLVKDNEAQLAPTLARMNSVLAVLEKNKDNMTQGIQELVKFETTLGEAVSSGPFFNAYVQNLIPGTTIKPLLDLALAPYLAQPAAAPAATAPGVPAPAATQAPAGAAATTAHAAPTTQVQGGGR